ncbi:MAG TPA: hypothetical protein VMA73_08745 [Streptosporangiaceae bacterium]|nr:hypothetical protein [Streptosporangiaceae bacterium]
MAHLFRLLSPGVAFASLGIIVLAAGEWNWFQLRGGLVTLGLYGLALQIVLSALLTSGINDLSGSDRWHRAGSSARPINSQGLADFYLRSFLPALLLGFGLGASLSALAVGSFHDTGLEPDLLLKGFGVHRSEGTLGLVLVVGAALAWRRGGSAYFGWVIGVGLAAVFGQAVFVPWTDVAGTVLGWGGLAAVLCLLRLLALWGAHVWRVGLRPHPPRETG